MTNEQSDNRTIEQSNLMEKITSLAKRRGFIYPGSEIYGGISGFYDYGPLGVELKNNIKKEWWKKMVYGREDVVGLDAAIIMNPKVWEASGHTEAFTDPLVECKVCHKRFRADAYDDFLQHAPKGVGNVTPRKEYLDAFICIDGKQHPKDQLTEPRTFNLLTEVYLGVTEPKEKAYLRGEITQGVFANFKNVLDSSRLKVPFGIAQIGKAFRNEITPGNFTYRTREFEQMELEFFIKPDDKEAEKWFEYWKKERLEWYIRLGMRKENLRFRKHKPGEIAHYAKMAEDVEYQAPFGWSEFEGIHHRGDWDLKRHAQYSGKDLSYFDEEEKKSYIPWVIETSGGVDRSALFFLIDAYDEEDPSADSTHSTYSVQAGSPQAGSGQGRVVLKLHPKLAPIKVAVFPLVANKPELIKKARSVYELLTVNSQLGLVAWDDRGNIGKRYFSQDEIGTPWCVTVDYQTLEDETVTVRDRDTKKQDRPKISELSTFFSERLS